MTTGSKLNFAHHLRSSLRLHDDVSRLGRLPVALRATERLRTSSLKPQIANLNHPGTASGRDASASPSHTPGPEDAKPDHGKRSPASPPRQTVDWWTRLATAIVGVNAFAHNASERVGNQRKLDQAADLRNNSKRAESPRQSISPKVVAPVVSENRLINGQSVVRSAVLAVRCHSGLDALAIKLRDSVTVVARAISHYSELVLQNSKVRGVVDSFTSIVTGPQRQTNSLTAAIAKTIVSSASRKVSVERVRPRFIALQRAAVIATLAAPLLAAPAFASIPATRREGDASCPPSIVINSTPTVVVNAHQGSDIEQKVLEALRQHRAELYEQWHREVRRRQRTEF